MARASSIASSAPRASSTHAALDIEDHSFCQMNVAALGASVRSLARLLDAIIEAHCFF
jgi:hypothetical protein